MNRANEFRRLRWLLQVQDLIQGEKHRIMSDRLAALNVEESSLEFTRNELDRLLVAEQTITKLSYTYNFDREPTMPEIMQYVNDMLGLKN